MDMISEKSYKRINKKDDVQRLIDYLAGKEPEPTASPTPTATPTPVPTPTPRPTPSPIPTPVPPTPTPVPSPFDYEWIGGAVNDEFKEKVLEISEKLQMDPDDLMAVMSFESGFNPAAVNKKTGATGLIQFMPTIAEGLGTSVDELVKMSAIAQLDYVYKYFKPYTGKLNSVGDAYLVTFCPALVGKADDDAIYVKGSTDIINKKSGKTAGEAFNDNKKMDLDKDQRIEKWEIVEKITKEFEKYRRIN